MLRYVGARKALPFPGIAGGRLIDSKLTGFLAADFNCQCPKHRKRAMLLSGEPKKRVCVVRGVECVGVMHT